MKIMITASLILLFFGAAITAPDQPTTAYTAYGSSGGGSRATVKPLQQKPQEAPPAGQYRYTEQDKNSQFKTPSINDQESKKPNGLPPEEEKPSLMMWESLLPRKHHEPMTPLSASLNQPPAATSTTENLLTLAAPENQEASVSDANNRITSGRPDNQEKDINVDPTPVSPIPEPSTYTMMITGLLLLLLAYRRKKAAKSTASAA